MLKMIGKVFVLTLVIGAALKSHASCEEYEAEAEAFEGVVPRFNESGQLQSLSMYGEGTFLVAKRSLINDARRKAELTARRAYSEFLNSGFNASTLASSLIETKQKTDQDGNTSGSVEELESTLNMMQNDTSSVMSGVIKLDECVDTEGKYLLVRMGWKPSLSRAAAEASETMEDSVSRKNPQQSKGASTSTVAPAKGYRKKSSMADDF